MQATATAMLTVVDSVVPTAQAVTPPAAPSDLQADAGRFTSLLGGSPTDAVDPTSVVPPVNGAKRATLGDAIIDRLQTVGDVYRTGMEKVQGVLTSSDSLGVSQALTLQMRMADLSLQADLFSKGVSKLLQHVDQLTKLQ